MDSEREKFDKAWWKERPRALYEWDDMEDGDKLMMEEREAAAWWAWQERARQEEENKC